MIAAAPTWSTAPEGTAAMDGSPRRPAAPRVLAGRYRLRATLGRGSSATVYSATDLRLRRLVTVKLFDPIPAGDPGVWARFRRQATKAAALRHPHIVAVLDAGLDEESDGEQRPFVVMEPSGPLSLRVLLDRRRRRTPRQAVELARQVASALSYAHRRGLVHADVKPENVLLDETMSQAKLVDFSLSFVSAQTGAVTPETIARRAAYLAPEQVRGDAVGPATDVYALGALLYEMTVGRPPFVGHSPRATAERRLTEHARLAGVFEPSVPRSLESVIARALERSPDRRWSSVDDLSAALCELDTARLRPVDPSWLALESSSPAPSGHPSRARGWRRWLILPVPVLAGIAALALGLASLRGLTEYSPGLESLFGRTIVPDVVGMPVEEAQARARERGMELSVVGERVSDRSARGRVIQQSPVGGPLPGSSQPLRVTVSLGVAVPDVRGQPLDEATALLSALSWRVGRVDRGPHPGHPPTSVVFQHPPPGAIVEAPGELALAVAE